MQAPLDPAIATPAKATTILRWSAIVVALVLLIGAALLALSAKHLYIVTSGSMVPRLQPGDVDFVEHESYGDLQVGDVITFDAPGLGQVVTHRIVSIDGSGISTKGDLNEQPDEWRVQPGDLRGEMKFSVPKVGRYLSDIRSSNVGFLAVSVPLVLLIILQSKSVAVEWRKWRNRAPEGSA
jgi:signal peptidase